jgi:DNA-binding beta-propeller fold protein YncE
VNTFLMGFWACIFLGACLPIVASGQMPVSANGVILDLPVRYVLEGKAGGFGSVLGYFHFPAGISGDSEYVYVSDSGNDRVVKTDFYFLQFDSFQPISEGGRSLDNPLGIALDGHDVWVGDAGNHRVVRYTRQGIPTETFGDFGIFEGSFDTPIGVAARFGQVWVADSRNHRVQQFQNKVFLRSFGSWGDARETLQAPYDMLLLPTYELIVSDREQRRLAIFSDLGQWVQDIVPVFPKGMAAFGRIRGLGRDQDGRIFVADPDHGRVVVLQRDGKVLALLPVAAPEDVYAWGDLVFVTDMSTHAVLRFRRR